MPDEDGRSGGGTTKTWLQRIVGGKLRHETGTVTVVEAPGHYLAVAPSTSSPDEISPIRGIETTETRNDETTTATAWARVRRAFHFANDDERTFEAHMLSTVTSWTFLLGFGLGGLSGAAEHVARDNRTFNETHHARTLYAGKKDYAERKKSYIMMMASKRGFRLGLQMTVIAGGTLAVMLGGAAVNHDRMSVALPPLASGALAVALHQLRPLVGVLFTVPLGWRGQVQAASMGATLGLTVSAAMWLYALSLERSVPEMYSHLKSNWSDEWRRNRRHQAEVARIKKQHNLWSGVKAELILREEEAKAKAFELETKSTNDAKKDAAPKVGALDD